MSSTINIPADVTVSKIQFAPVKILDNGGKTVNLSYEGQPLSIETPSLNVPYGVNVYDKTPGAPAKYSLDLSLRGAEENDDVKALQTFLEAFDERMIDAGVENAGKWFKMANPNRDVIKAFYTPLVKYSRDANGALKPYPPTFKLGIRRNAAKKGGPGSPPTPPPTGTNTGSFRVEFYDPTAPEDDKGQMSTFPRDTDIHQVLVKRAQTTAIMQCTGVWFAGGKFGTTWAATQFRMDSRPEVARGPAFRSEAPDIRAFVAKKVAATATASGGAGGPAAEVEDEEEDAEAEEAVVAAVLPPVATKKAAPVAVVATAAFVEESVAEPIPVPKKAVVKKVVAKVAAK